jgi:hypothetical protein
VARLSWVICLLGARQRREGGEGGRGGIGKKDSQATVEVTYATRYVIYTYIQSLVPVAGQVKSCACRVPVSCLSSWRHVLVMASWHGQYGPHWHHESRLTLLRSPASTKGP